MGCRGIRVEDAASLEKALAEAETVKDRPTVIDVKVDKEDLIGGYDGWWDVPIAEVSTSEPVRQAREAHAGGVARERRFV